MSSGFYKPVLCFANHVQGRDRSERDSGHLGRCGVVVYKQQMKEWLTCRLQSSEAPSPRGSPIACSWPVPRSMQAHFRRILEAATGSASRVSLSITRVTRSMVEVEVGYGASAGHQKMPGNEEAKGREPLASPKTPKAPLSAPLNSESEAAGILPRKILSNLARPAWLAS